MRLAERGGAEIVSADSRQVYRGMDIATAKPTAEERRRVPHHMIDVADPGERYDVSRYQREGRSALATIAARGATAIVVGGTGLYVRALLDGLDLEALPRDESVRAALERDAGREGGAAMHRRLATLDPDAAATVDARNVRRVIRYLEVATIAGSISALWGHGERIAARKIGLAPPRDLLARRIETRVRGMAARGVLEETARLLAAGIDLTLPSMTGHGYPHWVRHLRGEVELDTAIALTIRDTRAYSKRQMTWFRKDPQVRWCDPTREDPLGICLE
ncbi:MAG: tRNA (adenosine(37)-N6)-dimethylallyltransferase MiaA [Chloroflexi bacterium]|nr:tRNA (adenosine(37)-N6)-dimethylallyltransferase MiaA [Chloroflexota bacterium]